ncbi:MAG TPA: L,D-transpeptidase family protein [Gemmatimonadales bacterium]
MSRAVLLVSACAVTGLAAGACHRDDPTAKAIRATVSSANPAATFQNTRWKLLRQIYADRDFRSLWIDGRRLKGQARDLIETLCHAEREGLRAADYDLAGLRTQLQRLRDAKDPDAAALAALDLRLTRSFLDYGADLLAGRLDPQAVDNGWYIRARRAGIDSILRATIQSKNFDDMIEPLRPRQHEYKELVQALESYSELQANGGWSPVPADRKLARGSEGASVGALRYRLQATGELRHAGGKPVYDDEVAGAVARFQERHGLPVDSAVNAATLEALNVPLEARIRQIELNLERYRWLPSDFGKRYILVNIPDYRLYAYDNGKEALTMRVIVGDEYGNATPVFADSMTYLVFRPQWDMPRQILVDEVIPKVRENIYYLAQHGYEVVDTARNEVVTDPTSIDWSDLDTANIHFRVRQKAGVGNALGNVKFMFPNQFSIYLHDTPADHLFQRRERTLSHGCVRVEDPVKLAGYVLQGQRDWNERKIREAMQPADSADVKPVPVDLEKPVPVYLVYLTAFVQDGALHFRDDPYKKDARVMGTMGKPAPVERSQCEQLEELAGG